jgi:phosphomevalonate kinase
VERVEYTWSNYKDLDVSPLTAVESMAKGARIEKIDDIRGLKSATGSQ